jgi:hypothetical protein
MRITTLAFAALFAAGMVIGGVLASASPARAGGYDYGVFSCGSFRKLTEVMDHSIVSELDQHLQGWVEGYLEGLGGNDVIDNLPFYTALSGYCKAHPAAQIRDAIGDVLRRDRGLLYVPESIARECRTRGYGRGC